MFLPFQIPQRKAKKARGVPYSRLTDRAACSIIESERLGKGGKPWKEEKTA